MGPMFVHSLILSIFPDNPLKNKGPNGPGKPKSGIEYRRCPRIHSRAFNREFMGPLVVEVQYKMENVGHRKVGRLTRRQGNTSEKWEIAPGTTTGRRNNIPRQRRRRRRRRRWSMAVFGGPPRRIERRLLAASPSSSVVPMGTRVYRGGARGPQGRCRHPEGGVCLVIYFRTHLLVQNGCTIFIISRRPLPRPLRCPRGDGTTKVPVPARFAFGYF